MITKIGLYIHIPYCLSKCAYCSFVSYAGIENTMSEYLTALKKEIELLSIKYKDKEVSTIFIGGGTPSCFISNGIYEIAECIRKNFKVDKNAEFTAEANPNSLNEDKVKEFVRAGINRVSMGLQTTNSDLLKMLGRRHTVQNFLDDIKILKENGITNLSADLMLALPNQTLDDVHSALDTVIISGVKHISAYGLMIEEGTPLEKSIASGMLKECPEDLAVKMYDYAFSYLKKAGYLRYEVSNFALKNYECKHNINYWNTGEYLGLGVSAHSYINNYRFENTSKVEDYVQKLKENKLPCVNSEFIDESEEKTEFIMLNLRKSEGFKIADYNAKFNADFMKQKQAVINKLLKNKFIEISDGNFKVSENSFNILNAIILELV